MDFKVAIALQLIDNFTRQISQIRQATEEFEKQINRTQAKLQKFQETLKKTFDPKNLWQASERMEDFSAKIAQATAIPVSAITKALSAFTELEHARTQMEVAFMTSTGLPKELKEINQQVEELGIKLPGSATVFYRVATALKSLGMSAEDIAKGALKGASYAWVLFKEEVSPEQAAEYMQQFANAFKIPANQFVEFIDQLQRVKFASGLTLSEIAYSTKYFSAELNQLGFTGIQAFKLVGAWLGTLKQAGLQGETAGTSIRSVLQRIPELQKHLEKLNKQGINLQINARDFVDEKGVFKLEEFLITLRARLSELQDPIQRMQAMRELFDMEGMRAIAPLMARTKEEALSYIEVIKETLSPEEYQRLREQIERGGFSGLEDMAKRMQQQASLQARIDRMLGTMANTWESFQGTLTQLAAVIGELVAPSLKKLVDTLNNFIGKVANFIQSHQTLAKVLAYAIGSFITFLVVLGTLGLILASVIKLFSFAFSPFVWLVRINLIRSFTAALIQNSVALLRWAWTGTASTGWLKALDFFLLKAKLRVLELILAFRALFVAFLTNPIGLIITGILALVVAGYLLYKNWDKVSKVLSSAFNWLIMTLNKLVEYVRGINLFDAGQKIIRTLWEGMKSMANKPVEAIKEIAQRIRNFLPFSPAKEGPLRDLHRIKLVETIAQALKPAPLALAVKNTLRQAFMTDPIPTRSPVSIVININGINVSGDVSPAQTKRIAATLEREIRTVLERIANERFRRQY
jgi:TP901 family phage tail tape measure protein